MGLFETVGRALQFAGARLNPPKVPHPADVNGTPPAGGQPDAETMAWARRTVERVRVATVTGQLKLPVWSDPLNGETAEMQRQYDQMVSEPMIFAGLQVQCEAVAAQDLQVIPQNRKDRFEQEQAEFVRYACRNVFGGSRQMVMACLLPAFQRGWSVTEPTWKREDQGRWDQKWLWEKWKQKPVKILDPVTDEFRNLIGIRSRLDPQEVWDVSDFVIYSHLSMYENPKGVAAFRVAHRDWYSKQLAVRLQGLGLEKWSAPMLVASGMPANARAKQAALARALDEAGANKWLIPPPGVTVEALSAATSGAPDWTEYIKSREQGMLISFMGSHLAVLEGGAANVAGDSRTQRGTTELLQWGLSTALSWLFTWHARQLCFINFPNVPPPWLVLGSVSEDEIRKMLENDKLMQDMGAPPSMDSLYVRSSRQPPTDDTDRPVAPALAAGPPTLPFSEDGPPDEKPPPGSTPPKKDPPPGPADSKVALAGKDGRTAESMLAGARAESVRVMGDVTRDALGRMLARGFVPAAKAGQLFNEAEKFKLADHFAGVLALGQLLGRTRIRRRQELVTAGVRLFAEDGTPFRSFAESSMLPVLAPEEALDYFKSLTPTIGVTNVREFVEAMQRQSFTLAVATEQSLLVKVQRTLTRALEAGTDVAPTAVQIEKLMDQVGVTPRNPQYAEMVTRTNTMDAYNVGAQRELQDPDVIDAFPVWKYLGIEDGRQGADHFPRFGLYYPSSRSFTEVRGPRPFNCRCTFAPVASFDWEELQAGGARLAA